MHSLVRLILPITQVVFAASVLVLSCLRCWAIRCRVWDGSEKWLIHGLNAPAHLIVVVVENGFDALRRHIMAVQSATLGYDLDPPVETFVFLSVVAVLWYLVAIEIDSRKPRWASGLTSNLRARGVTDLVLIALGLVLGGMGLLVRNHFGWYSIGHGYPFAAPYFLWAAVLVGFYAHDLWLYWAGHRASRQDPLTTNDGVR